MLFEFAKIVVSFSKAHIRFILVLMQREKQYRQLHVPIRKPLRLMDRFAWLAGIALAVLFLACVAMAYYAHRVK